MGNVAVASILPVNAVHAPPGRDVHAPRSFSALVRVQRRKDALSRTPIMPNIWRLAQLSSWRPVAGPPRRANLADRGPVSPAVSVKQFQMM